MVRALEFNDDGNIITNGARPRAVVRFPTPEELAAGMTEVPRNIRVREYQERKYGK